MTLLHDQCAAALAAIDLPDFEQQLAEIEAQHQHVCETIIDIERKVAEADRERNMRAHGPSAEIAAEAALSGEDILEAVGSVDEIEARKAVHLVALKGLRYREQDLRTERGSIQSRLSGQIKKAMAPIKDVLEKRTDDLLAEIASIKASLDALERTTSSLSADSEGSRPRIPK